MDNLYYNDDLQELKRDKVAYDMWKYNTNSNDQELRRIKKALPLIMRDYLTTTQRLYFTEYFVNALGVSEIAKLYGKDKSTISRTLHRGLRVLFRHCYYLMDNPPKRMFNYRLHGGLERRK